MIRRCYFLLAGLLASLAFESAALAANRHSDRLADIDRVISARGYRKSLASGGVSKTLDDGTVVSITLWMKSSSGKRLHDARQIKFAQFHCESPGFSVARFLLETKAERDVFFRDVIGRAPPVELEADLQALGYGDQKVYSMSPFGKLRLMHRSMKCDGHGGESYELDVFP